MIEATTSAKLDAVGRQIDAACREANRDPASVTLIAVSKTFAADAIAPVIAAGQRVFGENRVQEAQGQMARAQGASILDVALHLIGPLQSNKAQATRWRCSTPSMRSTAPQPVRGAGQGDRAGRAARPLLLAEINTGGEPQKSGVAAAGRRRVPAAPAATPTGS